MRRAATALDEHLKLIGKKSKCHFYRSFTLVQKKKTLRFTQALNPLALEQRMHAIYPQTLFDSQVAFFMGAVQP